ARPSVKNILDFPEGWLINLILATLRTAYSQSKPLYFALGLSSTSVVLESLYSQNEQPIYQKLLLYNAS
ncbi:hypothetical protein QR685DRAFT_442204, partial [Neurospora intermedia]